jgi:hypothetical protein
MVNDGLWYRHTISEHLRAYGFLPMLDTGDWRGSDMEEAFRPVPIAHLTEHETTVLWSSKTYIMQSESEDAHGSDVVWVLLCVVGIMFARQLKRRNERPRLPKIRQRTEGRYISGDRSHATQVYY